MVKTIVLVLRSGGDFKYRDVLLLASRILQPYRRDNLPEPRIVCLSDTISDRAVLRDVELWPMENAWPGWWAKMNLFSPALEELRPFLYLDLDSAVVDKVEKLGPVGKNREKFITLEDFYNPRRSASGMMWIPAKSTVVGMVWNHWIKDPIGYTKRFRGDQDFLHNIKASELHWQAFAGNMIQSFKPRRGQRLATLPKGTVSVCFHGHPRIWEAVESVPWVSKYVSEGIVREKPKDGPETHRVDAKIPIIPWFSVLCPTWGRPNMAARYVESLYSTSIWPDRIETLLYVDEDDPMLSDYVKITSSMSSKIIVGPSEGVGKAWNALARASSGRYLMMGNDDVFCETWGWDRTLVHAFAKYPDGIFLGYVNDGINKDGCHCAFPIVSRAWYNSLGEFVPEHYKFFRHDTEIFDVAKKIERPDRILYFPGIMMRHNHATTTRPTDPTHERNRKANQNKLDEQAYNATDKERLRKAFRLRKQLEGSDHCGGPAFRDLVQGKRVALVGPSPHLQGKRIGSVIDNYDVVCRVNELFPFGLEADYGSRTDIVFHCCNQYSFRNFEKAVLRMQEEMPQQLEQVRMFVWAQRRNDPVALFTQDWFFRLLHKEMPETAIAMMSYIHWSFYSQWIGTHPNTGILSLCMLANAEPSDLFLTGFSFYHQGLSPEQRHHSAYVAYGGDDKYNGVKLPSNGGHLQGIQKAWFTDHFLPVYGENLVLDSFLTDVVGIKHERVVNLANAGRASKSKKMQRDLERSGRRAEGVLS